MRLETFFEKFDLLSDVPDAVPRLRRLVLDFAVRGKLTRQEAGDEPARELLNRVRNEKARLEAAGEIKKQGDLPPVAEDAIGFPLPSGWMVSQLGDVAVCLDYMREPINGAERELRIAGKSEADLYPYFGATQQQGWIDDFIFDAELVLLGEDGVPFFDELRRKAYLISGKSWVNNHAHVFRGVLISNRFLMHWLNTFDYSGRVAGSTRPKLNQARALDIPMPVPPLAEQERIVAKVDELMALCDRLEAQQQERQTRHAALARASLDRFADAPTPANLSLLFHKTRDIESSELRKLILSLAVQGRIVPFPGCCSETLGHHVEFLNGFAFKSEWFRPSGVRLCRNANVGHGALDWKESAFVEESVALEFGRFALSEGDLVLSLDRPIISTGLKVARVTAADLPCLLLQRVAKPMPKHDDVDLDFLMLWFNSSEFIDSIDPGRSNGVPHISTKQVMALPFTLPPLKVQRQVVATTNALLRKVEMLELQVASARNVSAKLMGAVVNELTATA